MQPARLLSEPLRFQVFRDRRGKGDDVVLDLGLDLSECGRPRTVAFVAIANAASTGMTPDAANSALAAASTCSQQAYLFSSVQMRPIAGRV